MNQDAPRGGDVHIGVDVGGTFTDVVVRGGGRPDVAVKVPTTRSDPSRGVLDAVAELARRGEVALEAVGRFVHGTTVATNAVLERKGARVGLVTSQGFRDILELGRQMRQALYDLELKPETPTFLAPGAQRREVPERIGADGSVVAPLDEAALREAVDELVEEGAEAIAVVFLFAFLNPVHERRAREIIAERHPSVMVSTSTEVDPAFREYERTVVTAFDAYIKPVVDRYLARLEDGVGEASVAAPLQIMQSRGGVSSAKVARQRPVRLFLSGPAAGVVGGREAAELAGLSDVITVDVGGTSCDIAMVRGGDALIRSQGSISGYPVRVPMVDVNAIGAGGGSIAWVDGSGSLRVGPHSAGSEPGPACYGRGGEQATVTDASLVLGYLDPAYFADGTMTLHVEAAQASLDELGARLKVAGEAAALGVHRVINAQMAEGIRLISIRRGFDPREFALVTMGGAGGLHACALAEELGITRLLVPAHPGVLSASGLLAAPIEHEAAAAFPRTFGETALSDLRAAFEDLDRYCASLMAQESVGAGESKVQHLAEVCYVGQSHHLAVALNLDGEDPLGELYEAFLAEHDRVHGHASRSPARFVNLRSIHRAAPHAPARPGDDARGTQARGGSRRVLLPEPHGGCEAAVHRRAELFGDAAVAGPAIVEQADTTLLIWPGWTARPVPGGSLLLERTQGRAES